jgi:polyisoprenoid-binding protein YceI
MITRIGFRIVALSAALAFASGQAVAATVHLQINPQKSQVKTSVADPLGRFRDASQIEGTLHIISGAIDGDSDRPVQSGHISLIIDATSYDSGNSHRDNAVLRSALNTAQYQTISFESTRIEDVQIEVPGKMGHATIVGNLTLHGTTREVRVPASISLDTDGTLSGDGELTLQYTDFGVRIPRLLFALPAGKTVTITFHILAEPPQSAQVN